MPGLGHGVLGGNQEESGAEQSGEGGVGTLPGFADCLSYVAVVM